MITATISDSSLNITYCDSGTAIDKVISTDTDVCVELRFPVFSVCVFYINTAINTMVFHQILVL